MKDYIGWAAENDYAVIDVNIPKHVQLDPVSVFALDCYSNLTVAGTWDLRRRGPKPADGDGGAGGVSVGQLYRVSSLLCQGLPYLTGQTE